jgi:hypothetical protein
MSLGVWELVSQTRKLPNFHLPAQSRPIPNAATTMKKKLTVYQKPTCTKCRTTLRLLQERGAEFQAINYFETRLTEADLR